MKIFRIGVANENEEINLDEPVEARSVGDRLALFDFSCQPRAIDWKLLAFYVINPFLKHCDIAPLLGNVLWGRSSILGDHVLNVHLHNAGELLPIKIGAEDGFLLNVLTCYNALDVEKSEWRISPSTGIRGSLKKHTFHVHRLPRAGIFKVPETCKSEILVASDPNNCVEDDFYLWYQHKGYNGLVFREIWTDEAPDASTGGVGVSK